MKIFHAKCFWHSPARDVLRRVTLLFLVIVHLPQRTTQFTRLYSVQTNVELLAVVGMRELGVRHCLTIAVHLRLLRTLEPILQLACSNAAHSSYSL